MNLVLNLRPITIAYVWYNVIMKLGEGVSHLLGIDYLKQMRTKSDTLAISATGSKDVLPTETDLKTAVQMYGLVLRSMFEYPFVLVSRWTGIDLAYKFVKKHIGNSYNGPGV